MLPDVKFLGLYLYDWAITLGVVAALIIFRIYAERKGVSAKLQNFCLLDGVGSVALGYGSAVLFQGVYNFVESGYFILNRSTGATFYGGLIGGAAVFLIAYFTLGKKICGKETTENFRTVSGCAICGIVFAHALGRIGCLMAGCCYGMETDSVLGMHLPAIGKTVIPTQLYESVFLFLLFGALTAVFFKTKLNCLYLYMISYGLFRFLIEFLRGDDRGALIPFLSPSQVWSVLLIVAGVGLLIWSSIGKRKCLSER